ncbi:polysaccharide pyruvyl transferase family protein [Novosphingobium mangrovi (ex Huang et al. 2023)]|uniref:Polysaccharide pyruvyl transferase family protein n=1 Tax=Novosphingobium mangrovi (ex Huang et al. 2023) TaxID=2976432 RepID=A0ABT2I0T5_9SPHN|nr:polysaccharide pyruvyl transferase family protein [Novosphingobium mangrovi (ex Huang et al. 2023)]MCT2398411.1 polysaccharide pyruvyl transferase family protein [Novosphingobium mangrovi (ex Huang et al. 2023)]
MSRLERVLEGDDPARHVRIGLLWHSVSSGNLGVGALTLGNIAIVRQVAERMGLVPHFVVMSMRDGDAPALLKGEVEVFVIDSRAMLSPAGFWKAVGDLDCVLDIGAGDSFAEIYGAKRFGFLWLTKMMAVARHVPLVLSPQTIGPFTSWGYRRLGAMALRNCDTVLSRDQQSLDVSRALAPRARNEMSVDVAFMLPHVDRSAERGGARLRVGVNASGLLYHQAESGNNRFGLSYDYAEFTRVLLERLCARDDVEVHLVPHATSKTDPTDDDNRLADRLAVDFPSVVRVPAFDGPSQAKSYISSLDFLVAGRMHACIGAYSAGTPVVPVAYSRKFSGLFGLLEYDHVLPMTGMSVGDAVDFALRSLDERDRLAQAEREGMKKVDALLDVYRSALSDLFTETLRKRQVKLAA